MRKQQVLPDEAIDAAAGFEIRRRDDDRAQANGRDASGRQFTHGGQRPDGAPRVGDEDRRTGACQADPCRELVRHDGAAGAGIQPESERARTLDANHDDDPAVHLYDQWRGAFVRWRQCPAGLARGDHSRGSGKVQE